MKTKKLAAMLITVSMVLGSMSGLVWADTETDSTEPSTEQVTEITDETSEETESSEETEAVEEIEVEEEEAEETEAPEEIDETIETEASDEDIAVEEEGDVYEAEDATTITVDNWGEFIDAITSNNYTVVELNDDIYAAPNTAPLIIQYSWSIEEINLGGHKIDFSTDSSGSFYFNLVAPKSLTIKNGEIVESCCPFGVVSVNAGGTVTLDGVRITDCQTNYGVVQVVMGTLNLNNTSITDNRSLNGYSGILCGTNAHINLDGDVDISNNHSSISTPNYHVDNLHFSHFGQANRITFGENFSNQSNICISGINPGTQLTSGWNRRNYYSVFSFTDDLDAVLDGNEVYTSSISYLSRSWNETSEEVVPSYVTIDEDTEFSHINADAFDPTVGISGTVYIYEDMVVANRIYVAKGKTLNIVIADGVTLTCNGGIGVHSYVDDNKVRITSSLYIYGQTDNDTGILIANAPEDINCAGIGGSTVGTTYYDGGEVYISGCTVRATGNNAAGIGGITSYIEETETRNIVHGTNFQKVEIYGGNVTAIGGGDYGDDIGTGMDGAKGSGTVSIYGGTVTLPHVNGYQIGVNNPQRITLAPNICVFNGYEYCDSSSRTSAFVVPVQYTIVISPCDHTNIAGENLYTDINDDTHTYHCPYCGTDQVQSHTYDNGLCICGCSSETSGYFVGHALQLSGQIGLQFFVNLPSEANPDNYRVSFEGDTTEYRLEPSSKTTFGAYCVQLNINPIQMADHFTPVLHLVDSEDPIERGRCYCAMDYVTWARSATTIVQPSELKILEALADYGFYSQIYLSRIDGWSIGIEHEAINLGRTPSGYLIDDYKGYTAPYAAIVNDNISDWCTSVSMSVRFGDQLMIRAVFMPKAGEDFTVSDFTVTGVSNISVTQRQDGAFVVTIRNPISAMNIIDTSGQTPAVPTALYNFQVEHEGETGVLTVSPLSYAYAVLNNSSSNTDCQKLVCALYAYASACNDYTPQGT